MIKVASASKISVRACIASHIACAEKGTVVKAAIKLSAAVLTALTATSILLTKSRTAVSSPFTVIINAGTPGIAVKAPNAVSKTLNAVTKVVSSGVIIAVTAPVRVVI